MVIRAWKTVKNVPCWFPCEGGINVGWDSSPVLVDLAGIPGSHTVLGQFPVVVSLEDICAPVCCQEDGINFGSGTDVVIVEVRIQSWNRLWNAWAWSWNARNWSLWSIQGLHSVLVVPADQWERSIMSVDQWEASITWAWGRGPSPGRRAPSPPPSCLSGTGRGCGPARALWSASGWCPERQVEIHTLIGVPHKLRHK